MDIQQWKDKGAFYKYEGHDIFYVREGNGPPLLLLHGYPTASWDWVKIWPSLIQQFDCIAFDFMGFGYSDKPNNYTYDIFGQTDLSVAFLRSLGLAKIHLLAHDYGTTVVQELLARQNQGLLEFEITTITLLNGGLFPEVYKPRLIQKLLMSPLGPILGRLYKKKNLQKTFSKIFGPNTQASAEEIDGFWELINYNNGRAIVHKFRYMEERVVHKERWLKALQEAKCPIRLINGLADPISGANIVDLYLKVIPKPDCIQLEGIGHYPQVEAPEAVLSNFFDFVKGAK